MRSNSTRSSASAVRRFVACWAWCAAALLAVPTFAVPAVAGGPLHQVPANSIVDVRIRVVVFGQLSAQAVAAIRTEVGRIWSPAGVRLIWPSPGQQTAVAQNSGYDVTVLVEDDPVWDSAPRNFLAFVSLRSPSAGTPVAVIFTSIARTRRLVEQRCARERLPRTFVESRLPIVLGRAIAHELGHYLLGSTIHSRSGLMRASLSADDVLNTNDERFALDLAQILALRAHWFERRAQTSAQSSRAYERTPCGPDF